MVEFFRLAVVIIIICIFCSKTSAEINFNNGNMTTVGAQFGCVWSLAQRHFRETSITALYFNYKVGNKDSEMLTDGCNWIINNAMKEMRWSIHLNLGPVISRDKRVKYSKYCARTVAYYLHSF